MSVFDLDTVRRDFPILQQTAHAKPLVFLDNASTTQKPQKVIDSILDYYTQYSANIHRGVYQMSQRATQAYERARATVQRFIHARDEREIVFTSGTTEAINCVVHACASVELKAGDEIIVTQMEHHSNFVPWQQLAQRMGAVLRVVDVDEQGVLNLKHYASLLNDKTKWVALTHISNVLGTINPVKQMTRMAHEVGAKVLLDGAQAVAHGPVDVTELDCDFYAFSGHKLYGPTGIGVLYGKFEWLERMAPIKTGGGMIEQVHVDRTTFAQVPARFEAGTPNIVGAIGLSRALDYLSGLTLEAIAAHESVLLQKMTDALLSVSGVRLIGTAPNKSGVLSFVMDKVHPHDLATIFDAEGVAIRAGHHCAMPLMERYGLAATARVSLGVYNKASEIEAVLRALDKAKRMFQ